MSSTFSNLIFHAVFSTKARRPFITPDLRPRLYDYMGGIVRGEGGRPLEIRGTEDHVHLCFSWRTDGVLSDLIRDVKSNSSKWVHGTFRAKPHFYWQTGYGVFSVSQSQCGRVRNYIRRQETHHRRSEFKEEFLALLNAHGIEYDERYILD